MKKFFTQNKLVFAYWNQGKYIIAAVFLGKAVSFIWKLILARYGPEAIGAVEIAMTVFFTLQAFSLLGLQTALIRFATFATRPNAKQSKKIFLLSLRVAIITGGIIIAIFSLFPSLLTNLLKASTVILPSILGNLWVVPVLSVSELFWSMLAANKRVSQYAFSKYVLPPIMRVFALLVVLSVAAPSPHILVTHLVVAAACSAIVSAWLCRPFLSWKDSSIDASSARKFLTYSLPMGGSFILYAIYGGSDVVLVANSMGLTSAGLLSVARLVVDIPNIALSPVLNIFQVYLGPMKRHFSKGLEFAQKNILILTAVSGLVALVVTVSLPYTIPFLFNSSYLSILPVVCGLFVSYIIEIAVILPLRHTLDFYGYTALTFRLMLLSTIVKIATGIWSVNAFGLNGVIFMNWAGVGIHLAGIMVAIRALRSRDTRQESRI